MIRITSGTVRTSQGLKTSKDMPFTLPPEEEKRFLDRNVAARVYLEAPLEAVATASGGVDVGDAGVNTSGEEDTAEVKEITVNLDAEQLMTMKLEQLKQLAKDMGINTTGLRTKDDYAQAIAAEDVTVGAPALMVEAPVE